MKLVRDRIPEIMREKGKKPIFRFAQDKEFEKFLLKKVNEELTEFEGFHAVEELADLIEAVYSLGKLKGISPKDLEKIRLNKIKKNGDFSKRIILKNPASQ
ncbi:nucleoside triphosphate pyrophosphohydrolase [Candidatus Micrarchaeota archaeon]|nr:nucleoside triphosphate pyrophosphohydrolase [Candidatus Micrarchaeota archaeon]MBU1930975.1 nucleoside triphosphate pyrophosphohydrolase [Candidatus Micrarchaeota archaeon]